MCFLKIHNHALKLFNKSIAAVAAAAPPGYVISDATKSVLSTDTRVIYII